MASAAAAGTNAGSSIESRAFAIKAARSIAELQPRLSGVADVMVFLEVLGYTVQDAQRNGFADLKGLSQEIQQFIDIFEPTEGPQPSDSYVEIPTTARRVAEGLALSFGWLGSLVLLFVSGVSLWLSFRLPLDIVSVFIAGVFTGLILTEGPLQSFNKLFSFYHDQGNLPEAKRVLKRAYLLIGGIIAISTTGFYLLAVLTGFPLYLYEIGMVSLVTVAAFRVVYAIIYSLRKIGHLLVSYSLAFVALLSVYFGMGALIPDAIDRYFYALIAALVVLSAFALYDQYEVLKGTSFKTRGSIPLFFRKVTINKTTIGSRFSVQFWETLPNYLFGAFFFVLLFGDRFLSWFFNPVKVAAGIRLPFVFNSVYHTGADPALLVIFPALIIQYAMMSSLFGQVTNLTLEYSVEGTGKIERFLAARYIKLVFVSVLSAIITAVAVDVLVPMIVPAAALSPTSLWILHVASAANVLLVVFLANSIFLQFMNKMMGLAVILMVGAAIVIFGGLIVGQAGFQNLVIAYTAATYTIALASTLYVAVNFRHAASLFFARYI